MCFRPSEVGAADVPQKCPECGRENAPGEKKCMFCGAELPEEPVAAAPAAPAAPKGPSTVWAPQAPVAPKAPGSIPDIPTWPGAKK